MLIDEPQMLGGVGHPILSLVAAGFKTVRLQKGVYQIGHFGMSNWPEGYENYPIFPNPGEPSTNPTERLLEELSERSPYGVCDSVEQLLEHYPELESPGREFVVTVTAIYKAGEPDSDGWRWHKWGPYIGTQNHQYEYLANEPDIELVYVYHIYERLQPLPEDFGSFQKRGIKGPLKI